MPDVDPPTPGQLSIDVDALPCDHIHGCAPADPVERENARARFYLGLLDELPEPASCLPDRGVHIYVDHLGSGPCLCKTTPPTKGL